MSIMADSVCTQPPTRAAHFNVQLVLSDCMTFNKQKEKEKKKTVYCMCHNVLMNKICNVKLYLLYKKMYLHIDTITTDVYNHNILIY